MIGRGFTLLETVCVIAILAVLMAMSAPSVMGAWRESRVSVSLQRLRQLDLAIRLYEETHDGSGASRWESVPLDLNDESARERQSSIAPVDLWKSPCVKHPDDTGHYVYYPSSSPDASWGPYSAGKQDRSIYITDRNCNTAEVRLLDVVALDRKRVLVLRLDGSAQVLWRTGDIITLPWLDNQ
ncbi:MAG: type II secretion system protein [Fimbriimonadaceae bacterium]